jgi:peptidoglycan/xylan/chitin deacetylase (PgdA/CDA1 family)
MLAGRAALPDRPLLITFDDGLADFTRNALPVLQSFGHTCTMFVTTAVAWHQRPRSLGGRPTLSWSEIRTLPGAGVELGAHSHDHLQLDLLSAPRVASQLRVCKDLLEQEIQTEVRSFAYPHGYQRETTRRLVERAGFSSACAVKNELSHRHDNRWALARIMLTAEQSVPYLRTAISSSGQPLARTRERPRTAAWRAVRFVRTRGRPLIAAGDL